MRGSHGLAPSIAAIFAACLVACGPQVSAPEKTRVAASPPQIGESRFDVATSAKSTVRIVAVTADGVSTGTGVVIAPGVVATNRHVIEGASPVGLRFAVWALENGSRVPMPAGAVLDTDARLDLAVLFVPGLTSPAVAVSDAPPVQLEAVTALGFPASTDAALAETQTTVTATSGQVSKASRGATDILGTAEVILHTATLNPGNSGGPLFDRCGNLVGINTAKLRPTAASNVFMSISSYELMAYLASLAPLAQPRLAVCGPVTDEPSCAAISLPADVLAIEEALSTTPGTCAATRIKLAQARWKIISDAQATLRALSGKWRLASERCDTPVTIKVSGSSIVAASGDQVTVERISTAFAGGVETVTEPSNDEPARKYRYAVSSGQLQLTNVDADKTWTLQKCISP